MINLNISNGNLGDSILMTSLFKNNREGNLTFLDVPEVHRLEEVFYNFNVKIKYNKEVPPTINSNHKTHICQQYLDKFNITDSNCIPKINVRKEELVWAKDFLSKYENPLAIVTNNNGTGDKTNFWAQYRTPNSQLIDILLSQYGKKYTLLHFGLSRNFTKNNYRVDVDSFIKNERCVDILDLPLSKLIACYSVIGKYLGGDTGDYHLMLAVGGKCNVLVPEHHDAGYNHISYLYTDELWKNERVRVKYNLFKDYLNNLNYIDFNY